MRNIKHTRRAGLRPGVQIEAGEELVRSGTAHVGSAKTGRAFQREILVCVAQVVEAVATSIIVQGAITVRAADHDDRRRSLAAEGDDLRPATHVSVSPDGE